MNSQKTPKNVVGYCIWITCLFFLLVNISYTQWEPDDVIGNIPTGELRDALAPLPNTVAGPLSADEETALSYAIGFVPEELWYSSAMKIPLVKVPGKGLFENDDPNASATLYLVEYISRTYGMIVVQDQSNAVYSAWVESPEPSPLTGRNVLPLFNYSDGVLADEMTHATPSKDLQIGPLDGLGDDGSGSQNLDNVFSTDGSGRGYWPLYLRGYLTSGGMIPYSIIPFGNSVRSVLSRSEQSLIPSQRFNYLDTPNRDVIKVARHIDGVSHGWVPGDSSNFEVRFQLPAHHISRAVPRQAEKMREDNENGGETGILWKARGRVPARPTVYSCIPCGSPMLAASGEIAINAGGGSYTSMDNTAYGKDRDFSRGNKFSTRAQINGTEDDRLYQTNRYAKTGNFSYNIPVNNGTYLVTLKFAELYFKAANKRVFNVAMEGQEVITGLDVYNKVGSRFTAYDETILTNVSDRTLNIEFQSIEGKKQPMVMGIKIERQ